MRILASIGSEAVAGATTAIGITRGVFISETSVGLFTLWLFKRGKWKTAQV